MRILAKLQDKGYGEKELLNLRLDAQKLEDLEFLKRQKYPGPFTSTSDVKDFMDSEPESKFKNERMYKEIRFQRNSSTSMKRDSAVFRLKSCHKNLDTSDYVANLCAYLDHSRGATKLSMGDLRNVLNGLNTLSGPTEAIDTAIEDKLSPSDSASNTQESSYVYGEHVACVWCDDVGNGINWHLGVVDKVDGDTVAVSYMKRTD